MTGRDGGADPAPIGNSPVVVLVRPQLLDNDDMPQADALIRFPLNPTFMSLNLAQAVLVMAYEWWTADDGTPLRTLMTNETQVATKHSLENCLVPLVDQLDASGFLRNLP